LSCPDPIFQPEQYAASVAAVAAEKAIDVVMPMTEITTLLLAEGRSALPPGAVLPFADANMIETASDKAAVVTMARELRVPVPATVVCANAADVRAAISEFQFPIVVKPARSRVRTPEGWVLNRVEYAVGPSELLARAETLPVTAFPVLLQERILGSGIGFFVCYDRGVPIACFAHRRIREKPATGGVSVLCESIDVPPAARASGYRLLDRLSWHGVAMVEYKEDHRDGTLRLMEINARFWGSLQLAIRAGVDFPRILLDVASGAPHRPEPIYRSGLRSRWLLGDVDSLIGVLRARRSKPDSAVVPVSRWKALRDFLSTGMRGMDYDVMSLGDPSPGLVELRHWLLKS
jgi:predicted ATP-grasp superfamily ATP-dependent carboligase